MKEANNIKVNSEYKYYRHDTIAFIAITSIGFLLLLFGVEETITIAFIFSFVIFLSKLFPFFKSLIILLNFSGIFLPSK